MSKAAEELGMIIGGIALAAWPQVWQMAARCGWRMQYGPVWYRAGFAAVPVPGSSG